MDVSTSESLKVVGKYITTHKVLALLNYKNNQVYLYVQLFLKFIFLQKNILYLQININSSALECSEIGHVTSLPETLISLYHITMCYFLLFK